MPGRLVMDVKDPVGPGGLKRDGSHLSQPSDGPEQKRVAIATDASSLKVNGAGPTPVVAAPTTNGVHDKVPLPVAKVSTTIPDVKVDEPPEIEQFRETLVPFGKMLERMAQQTYFELSELVEVLADMRIQQQPQMTNGVGGQTPPDKSAISVDKKLRLLNFAQSNKDRFIKTLVLSDWARDMDDMSKLIDVSMFLRKQDWSAAAAADSIYRLKENMVGAKMPNPNIEGALELLSSGQAPWMPDMGYIPPKPLTADELLETLIDMNFALSVRLNLHEELPHYFKNYYIANGRVTFTVPDEFEVDLAIADQESDSPFYFIDLRLNFTPAISLKQDRLRNQLEAQVNAALVSSGLQGCYDFLHNFALTHKLNILRCQALELARGKWIDHIEVQFIHRAVIIQYWRDLPGGRNWIELGISSGKAERAEDGEIGALQPHSQLSCRWFRRGQEIIHHDLKFDFSSLSVERMLDHVIAIHAGGRLTVISDGLKKLSQGTTSFTQTLETSTTDATDCTLRVTLKPLLRPLDIRIDSVRGTFSASPGGSTISDLERRINGDGHVDIPLAIRNSLCRSIVQRCSEQAESVGLSRITVDVRIKTPSPFLTEPIFYRSFQLSASTQSASEQSQRPRFVLTAVSDFQNGLSWFLSQTGTTKDALIIEAVHALGSLANAGSIDREAVLAIQDLAAQTASRLTITYELIKRKVPFKTTHKAAIEDSIKSQFSVCVKVADVVSTNKGRKSSTLESNIFAETGTISHARSSGPNIEYTFRTSLLQKTGSRKFVSHLRRGLRDVVNINIDLDGDLVIILQTSLGGLILPMLRERLDGVSRLYAFVEVISDNHFGVVRATLDEICFVYGPLLTCTARICSPSAQPLLEFRRSGEEQSGPNPHQRIRRQLEDMFIKDDPLSGIQGADVAKFASFCSVLRASLPIVSLMPKIEDSEPPCTAVITCHSASVYKLAFRDPLWVSFQIAAKPKDDKLFWFVKLVEVKRQLSEQCKKNISKLWREKGKGWQGLRTAAMADATGIGELLERINTLMRQCEDEAPTDDGPALKPGAASSGKTASEAVVLD
ncbi:MED14-domain-containing protein [Myriangium duriaei CBS 260.36]|uniref:Mediator of RNA polymerase II transcription subunit 14 n=1 Tax=Myriangium duriaei CBS 260.36 TaxID=1168546 RepID=A0A9P4J667_9PEZI|nr:MED14-domain-containing protein [Myriangium duriaei CBS 260.36]